MTAAPQNRENPPRRRAPGARGHTAGMIALAALIVVTAAWFWNSYQPTPKVADAGLGLPHGVMVVGAGAFIAALIAEIRVMSAWEILESAWELLLGLFGAIGAVLKGIWNGILSLLGWD